MKLPLDSIAVVEGPLYEQRHWEDGSPSLLFDYYIEAGANDAIYTHHHSFRTKGEADALAALIKAAGEIDPQHWVEAQAWDGYRDEWTPEEEQQHAEFHGYA